MGRRAGEGKRGASSRSQNNNSGKVFVRREGVTNQIKLFFWKYPNASAKKCCAMLGLPYDRYKRLCWRIKSETKKLLKGKVQGRVLVPLSHRVEWQIRERLPPDVVETLRFEALKRQPRRDQAKPRDEWYVVPNRNRMMVYKNDDLTIRIFPKSGNVRILPAKPIDWDVVKIHLENAFFKAGLDLKVCEEISEGLEPTSRHRIFYVGPVTPFEIDFYKKPLGITIKADGSHPEHIEATEEWPTWIKPFLLGLNENTQALRGFSESVKQVERQVDILTKGSMTTDQKVSKLTDLMIVQTVNINKLVEASSQRLDRLERMLVLLVETLRKKRKRHRPRKPKPKSRWQKLRKKLRRE